MAKQLDNSPIVEGPSESKKLERAMHLSVGVIKSKESNPSGYEVDDSWQAAGSDQEIHSMTELYKYAKEGKIEVDSRVLAVTKNKESKKKIGIAKLNTKQFVEACEGKLNLSSNKVKMREGLDTFAYDEGTGSSLVGQDYTPLLGGPFNKQLYIYDYLRMHSAAFYAYNHDPIARAAVAIIRDFTLGRGWRADCKDPIALAVWKAFEEVNDLYNMMDSLAIETSVYGENMIWWLPNHDTKIGYELKGNQQVPKGTIPRVRMIDPSCIWEIVTYPEDITRVLYYQWVAPTQYQMYTAKGVPGSKFIHQQIPAGEVMHFKLNSVSNEKRGRSDLFPVLGYLKRLRDSVNYSVIGMQKNMAWSVDTSIDGGQPDIDAYVAAQQALGTIPPAGSEFVHSKKVERKYLSNEGGRGATTAPTFEWCLSMIAAGTGIPVSYFGTHLSGGQTRASALVATEPVTKKFEKRRLFFEQILQKMAKRLFEQFGLKNVEIEFTFPELVGQDSSGKIKNIIAAEMQGYISKERAASMVAKELDITEFDAKEEEKKIQEEKPSLSLASTAPFSGPGLVNNEKPQPSAVTKDDKKAADNAN